MGRMSVFRPSSPRSPSASSRWIDRWLAACSELVELERSNPMTDAVIDEIDGRMIRIGDQWLADFASCNYLGFDLDREIIEAVPEYLDKWGTHPSWSRMLGSPALYPQIEERLIELLGCEDAIVFPTITLIHLSVIPVLAGDGTIFVDNRAHKTIYDGCQFATARGATVKRFRFEDPDDLEQLLRQDRSTSTRLICMDGVNSMTGNAPDLQDFARLARRYDAMLYVDDAHGFGVIGERGPSETSPYGLRGNSIVRYCRASRTTGSCSSAASPSRTRRSRRSSRARPSSRTCSRPPRRLTSTPVPRQSPRSRRCSPASRSTRRAATRSAPISGERPSEVLECLDRLGVHTPNRSGFPIIEVPLARHEDIDAAGRFLFDHGIYVTLAAYPLVPKSEVGFRIQVTAANSQAEIEQLIDVLGKLASTYELRPAGRREYAA